MTDGLTEASRAGDRERDAKIVLKLVYDYLQGGAVDSREELLTRVAAIDEQSAHWRSQRSRWAAYLAEILPGLETEDAYIWARFLSRLAMQDPPIYRQFKPISPFAQRLLVLVWYSLNGGRTYYGDVHELFDRIIGQQLGFKTGDGDAYAVSMEQPSTAAEVFWVNLMEEKDAAPREEHPRRWDPEMPEDAFFVS